MTAGEIGKTIADRQKSGEMVEMVCITDGERTGFLLFVGDEIFAALLKDGDYRTDGSEANGLHSCLKYFFNVEEREA